MTPEQHIAQFLKELNEDIVTDNIFKSKGKYCNHFGLCANLTTYCSKNLLNFEDTLNVKGHLKQLFNGREHYPFNSTGEDYFEEIGEESLYLNPQRLAFINQHKAS